MASDASFSSNQKTSTSDKSKNTFGSENTAVRDDMENAKSAMSKGASGVVSGVQNMARETIESGKSATTESIRDFTAAVRKASEELGQRDQSMAADLVRRAASGLEQTAEAIEGTSLDDLARSITSFARRQPTAFLIGATLTGIALGRFARASQAHEHEHDRRTGNGSMYSSRSSGRGYDRQDLDRGSYPAGESYSGGSRYSGVTGQSAGMDLDNPTGGNSGVSGTNSTSEYLARENQPGGSNVR